jgi:hypothetical protein
MNLLFDVLKFILILISILGIWFATMVLGSLLIENGIFLCLSLILCGWFTYPLFIYLHDKFMSNDDEPDE